MRLWTTGLLVAAFALGSVGCVAQQELDRLQTVNRKKDEQIVQLQTDLEEAQATIDSLRAELTSRGDNREALQQALEDAEAERDRLRAALDEAEQQLRNMAGRGLELPQELSDDLADLAAQYPNLMSYDEELGMIKLRSDLTFALGSADVRDQAQSSLRRLAEVLGSREAQGYEIRIVGHTDDVPIQNPETRRRHPTNWHLSAHRAISVRDVLESAGITAQRTSVAGYGPYRPIVPNGPRGAEENRRVEIYLVPMTDREQRMADRVEADSADSNGADSEASQDQPAEEPAQDMGK